MLAHSRAAVLPPRVGRGAFRAPSPTTNAMPTDQTTTRFPVLLIGLAVAVTLLIVVGPALLVREANLRSQEAARRLLMPWWQ